MELEYFKDKVLIRAELNLAFYSGKVKFEVYSLGVSILRELLFLDRQEVATKPKPT